MASPARLVTAVGSVLFAVALIGGFVYERHMYGQRYIDSTSLSAALVLGAVLFGALAGIGFYVGLRFAKIRELPYRFGVRLALAYIALVMAINLIPMTFTIRSDDWRAAVSGLLLVAVCGVALPGILAYSLGRLSLPRGPSAPDKSLEGTREK